jgi:hypothetical protein
MFRYETEYKINARLRYRKDRNRYIKMSNSKARKQKGLYNKIFWATRRVWWPEKILLYIVAVKAQDHTERSILPIIQR